MPIAFDAATAGTWTTAEQTTITFNHTTAGSDRILLVGVAIRGTDDGDETVSGITYNGVALTKIVDDGRNPPDSSVNIRGELWYLLNPATGTNTIVVTLNGAANVTIGAAALTLTGVHQSAPLGQTAVSAPDSGTSVSTNITTQTDNSWVTDYVVHRNDIDITEGAGQTNRLENNNGSSMVQAFSTKLMATAGATSMSWSDGADQRWRHLVVEIKEAVATPAVPVKPKFENLNKLAKAQARIVDGLAAGISVIAPVASGIVITTKAVRPTMQTISLAELDRVSRQRELPSRFRIFGALHGMDTLPPPGASGGITMLLFTRVVD